MCSLLTFNLNCKILQSKTEMDFEAINMKTRVVLKVSSKRISVSFDTYTNDNVHYKMTNYAEIRLFRAILRNIFSTLVK